MKRSYLVAVVAGALAIAGCEDGPNQTFNPSPPGAGNNWNNGFATGNAGAATTTFAGATSTGSNLNEICDAQKKHTVWANMVKQTVHPPSVGGGLDIAGGPKGDGVPDPMNNLANEAWTGLTLDAAEKINCQSTFGYDDYGDGSVFNAYWGDNGEVSVDYLVSTRQILDIQFAQGYIGTLDVTSIDKADTYSIGIGVPIVHNMQAMTLDWNDTAGFNAAVNKMYGAVAATYSSFQPEPDCFATGHCIAKQLNDTYAYIWFTTVGYTMYFANAFSSPSLGATVIQAQQDKTKVLGFTSASIQLQNDAAGVGPKATSKNVFGSGKDCQFQLGQTFSTFRDTCVAPLTDTTKNATEMTKLYSGIGHGAESFSFDVVGFDPNFQATSKSLPGGWLDDQAVILDTDRPHDGDIGSNMDVDQNTVGTFANDWVNNNGIPSLTSVAAASDALTLPQATINVGTTTGFPTSGIIYVTTDGGPQAVTCTGTTATSFTGCTGGTGKMAKANTVASSTQDWHGIGLVTLEWMTLLQAQFNALTGGTHQIGDAACLVAPATAKGLGCSGLEGIVTTAPRNARGLANDLNALGDAPLNRNPSDQAGKAKYFTGISPGLKPTTWQTYFCSDGKGTDASNTLVGYTPANCNQVGTDFSYFKNPIAQMANVAGSVNALPGEFGDPRFMFKQWIFAFVKYLGVADSAAPTLAQVDAIPVDQNNLFFDSIGAGQFEFAEYIDRRNVTATTPPLDIRITADILHAIMNDFLFSRSLFRGESALYTAMRGNGTNPLGKDNSVFLTNVFGNPTIKTLYPEPDQKKFPGVHALDCATNITPQVAPIDVATDPCNNKRAPQGMVGGVLTPLKNDDGTLLLSPYKGAFTGTAFTVAQPSPITPLTIMPLIQAAWVEVPVYNNPYDATSTLGTPVRKLIPWLPQGADVGFPIAINGSQDQWIETFQIDFSGITISANVDYQMVKSGQSTLLQVQAVETTDFLGEVFLCADPDLKPSDNDAILHLRMYSSADEITTWFAAHPLANTACGMIYQYSEFGNYLDHVTSTTNGIRLDINPGGGQGRVVGATFYDPTVANQ